jgi:hypothetical protein
MLLIDNWDLMNLDQFDPMNCDPVKRARAHLTTRIIAKGHYKIML